MRVSSLFATILGITLVGGAGCGPSDRVSPGEETDEEFPGGPDAAPCVPQAETCTGGEDEDCDGDVDCGDSDCNGVGDCPNCGALDLTEGTPLALPDGEGSSYETSIDFTGFTDGQLVESTGDILGVCVVMEHSWLRDLQIEVTCPSGQMIVVQEFLGQEGSELYMGQPNDADFEDPVPGTGAEYCWSPTAVNKPMLTYANETGIHDLPPGDYQAVDDYAKLIGCTLNGNWTIKVTDLWGSDNGFIFAWGIKFNAAIVEDCSDWPVE